MDPKFELAQKALKDDSEPIIEHYSGPASPFSSRNHHVNQMPDLENQGKYDKYKPKQTQQIN